MMEIQRDIYVERMKRRMGNQKNHYEHSGFPSEP